MQKLIFPCLVAVSVVLLFCEKASAQSFSLRDVLSYPFPSELTASPNGAKIAWAVNEQGKRNVYVAERPKFTPRKLTNYDKDDGQEITSLAVSADGQWVVYVRGGDHGGRNAANPVNPAHDPVMPKVEVWVMPFKGGEAKAVAEGDNPVISPQNNQIAFTRNGQAWVVPLDGSGTAKPLFAARGSSHSLQWSPDGSQLAFVSARDDHAFIGVYRDAQTPITWLAPAFSRDSSPRWSPDGEKIAFVRTPGVGGAPDSLLAQRHNPWAIWTAEVATGKAFPLWTAPKTLRGSLPTTDGGVNLNWAADRVVFVSYHDGWPHLYSLRENGGEPLLLTPGNFMVEHVRLSPDRKWVVFSANAGPDQADLDRRHVARVPVHKAAMEILTPGTEIETYPVLTGDGSTLALFSASAQRPLLPAVMPFRSKGNVKLLAQNLIPATFPIKQMVTPKQVTYQAPDGLTVHAQLFEPAGGRGKKPAIVYVHGGPQRQMLLGWHHMDYYSIDYALNQYLANLGFVVLSVNYRLGVGYGYEFHKPPHAGSAGASEYQDVKAGAEWLAAQNFVDKNRIGIYGGSYGGFLAALALGKDSKLFAAGVDIHGVHNRTRSAGSERFGEAPDGALAAKVAWESSPVAYLDTWTSPVLLIHADDDRNVPFSQTVDLARRFEEKGFPFESLAIPDDTHHWMKFTNAVKVSEATADFFKRKLLTQRKPQ